jgi:hypothetical protein
VLQRELRAVRAGRRRGDTREEEGRERRARLVHLCAQLLLRRARVARRRAPRRARRVGEGRGEGRGERVRREARGVVVEVLQHVPNQRLPAGPPQIDIARARLGATPPPRRCEQWRAAGGRRGGDAHLAVEELEEGEDLRARVP